ncbi:hypothetical protein CPC08DRAFT_714729 [Agrocybe pediades]|nr:hypothetical protein CPC08DRAFT_714729 [Agrocybe pediades]
MAAVYLHDAKLSQTPSQNPVTADHARHLSSLSSATLHTNTTLHSQPTEPLLPPLTAGADEATLAYYEQLSRQPRNPDGSPAHLRWDVLPVLQTNPTAVVAKKEPSRRRKPGRRRRRVKFVLQAIIAAWSVYNTVRYFLAFTLYGRQSHLGQVLSLALGICSGVSFILAFIFFVMAALMNRMVNFGIVYRYIVGVRSALHYSSSLLIFSPTVANLVMVFLWRESINEQYDLHHRCHFDIDVVWSVTKRHCNDSSPSWGVWVAVSAVRLALTLAILVAYHTLALLYPALPRRPVHHRIRSSSGSESLTPAPSTRQSRRRSVNSTTSHDNHPDLRLHQHVSEVSLDEATLRGDSTRSLNRIRLARSHSSGLSGESNTLEAISFKRKNSGSDQDHESPPGLPTDRFRSILSQIAQETEEAMEYARSDNSSVHENPPHDTNSPPAPAESPAPSYSQGDHDDETDDDEDEEVNVQYHGLYDNIYNIYNLRPIPPMLGYNEFGLPYPPEQDVRVLNGYVRRMPTIESMGSGEFASSVGASSALRGESMYTSSRPPTRNTLLSFSSAEYEMNGGSPALSRANSLSARAELLVGMSANSAASEHGELVIRPEMIRRYSSPTSYLDSPVSPVSPHYEVAQSSTAGSRATASNTSYHTATAGSNSGDSYFPPYPDRSINRHSPPADNLGS